MISIWHETIVSLREATKILPRRRSGKRPHISCLYRWGRSGYRGIKLEVIRVGDTLCTSEEALQRFIEKTTAADPVIGTTDATECDNSEVEEKLDDLGI